MVSVSVHKPGRKLSLQCPEDDAGRVAPRRRRPNRDSRLRTRRMPKEYHGSNQIVADKSELGAFLVARGYAPDDNVRFSADRSRRLRRHDRRASRRQRTAAADNEDAAADRRAEGQEQVTEADRAFVQEDDAEEDAEDPDNSERSEREDIEGSEASGEFSDDGEPAENGESSSDDSQAPNLEGS